MTGQKYGRLLCLGISNRRHQGRALLGGSGEVDAEGSGDDREDDYELLFSRVLARLGGECGKWPAPCSGRG